MNIKPLFDRVVIEEEKDDYSKNGIFIGATNKENVKTGTVVFVGLGNDLDNGNKSEMHVKVGDKVIYSKFAGIETILDKKTLFIIRQTDILAVIE